MSRKNPYKPMNPVSEPGEKKPKRWTVMIYLSGDNNLSEECVWAIKELFRVGLRDEIAVVAQFQSVAPGMPVIRYDITTIPEPEAAEASKGKQVYIKPVRNDDQDGGLDGFARPDTCVEQFVTATALIQFATDCIELYPAEHYMLVLSGHGSGAVGKFFLQADREDRYLSIPMLAYAVCKINQVMATEKDKYPDKNLSDKLDVIGLDACAMSTVEVGYQLRDVARYMVGAEGFERNGGWPYHRVLETLNDKPEIEPEDLAKKIVKRYVKYYFDYAVAGVSVDQAACDLSRMEPLAEAINQLAGALQKDNQALLDAVILAHWRAQSYLLEDYVDLWDFCDLLQSSCNDTEVETACQNVKNLIDGKGISSTSGEGPAVLKSCYSGAVFQHSHGLSIYFPWVKISSMYSRLSFAWKEGPMKVNPDDNCRRTRDPKVTHYVSSWLAYLQEYVCKSQRSMRQSGDQKAQAFTIGSTGSSPEEVRFLRTSEDRFLRTSEDRFLRTSEDKFGISLEPKIKNPPLTFAKDPCLDESDD
jgi:hypothetical protein